MDFMEGEVANPLEDPMKIKSIVGILDHLASFTRDVPGPLAYGPTYSSLFEPEEGEVTFANVEELENWWNMGSEFKAKFQGLKLVLSHLNLHPKSFLWKEGEPPCLLNWAFAGFYPRSFEICQQIRNQYLNGPVFGNFHRLLLDAIADMESNEPEQITPTMRAYMNTIAFL